MFDVKVGDILLCKKDRPWSAPTRVGDMVKITRVYYKEDDGRVDFKYNIIGREKDNWSGSNIFDAFEPFSEDLENK